MASIVLESSKVILSFVLCYFENSRLSRLHEMLGFFIGPVLTLSAPVAIFASPTRRTSYLDMLFRLCLVLALAFLISFGLSRFWP